MKTFYITIFFFLFSFALQAQDDPVKVFTQNDILPKKWYGSSRFYSDRVVFLKKALPTDGKAEVRFMPSGKVSFCEMISEKRPAFKPNGEQYFIEPGLNCDSTSTKYQIKKDMIHITQDGTYHYYFRFEIVRTGNLEFLVTDPETFYKK